MRVPSEQQGAAAEAVGLGPNTAGLLVPGESSVGIMPGFAENIFRPGNVGVVFSRSGSLGTLVAMDLVTAGYGSPRSSASVATRSWARPCSTPCAPSISTIVVDVPSQIASALSQLGARPLSTAGETLAR